MEHICNFGAGNWNQKGIAYIFAEILNVSEQTFWQLLVQLVEAEEVSSIKHLKVL